MPSRVGLYLFLSALALAAGMNTVAAQVAPGQLTITPDSGPRGNDDHGEGHGLLSAS
jgi:hypothetical protein